MTARSIRRAAERKARKEALKAARQSGIQNIVPAHQNVETEYGSISDPNPPSGISEARLAANRANALRSTGPRTPAGKSVSARNALKTALTGRTVLLPTDDRARYEQHLTAFFDEYTPVGDHECALVQSLADTWWRLLRIPQLEAALYAKGRAELTGTDPEFLEIDTWLRYEKQFRNLALQEQRLFRYAERLRAELAELQAQRTAAAECVSDEQDSVLRDGFQPPVGFEFSDADLTDVYTLNALAENAAENTAVAKQSL